jgi:fucose 4-O-acetylase-like acetyltransferase
VGLQNGGTFDVRDASARERAGLSTAEIDAIRGFFILLVVLGHNIVVTSAVPGLFSALYSFHVYAFLFLPFVFPGEPLTRSMAADRMIRYLVPHTVFFGVAAVSFAVMFRRGDPLLAVGADVVVAWLVSSGRVYKEACGYILFWFLPALLSLVLVRGLWERASTPVRWAIVAGLIAVHGVVGALPVPVKRYVPFGLGIVAFTFPMALVVEWLWHRARRARALGAAFGLGAFVCGLAIFLALDGVSRIGSLTLYSWAEPGMLFLSSAIPVAAFIGFAASSATLARIPLLVVFGRFSLLIYLSHSLLFRAFERLVPNAWIPRGPAAGGLAVGFVLFLLTLGAAWLLARTVERVPWLRRWLTPRGVGDWPPTARWPWLREVARESA